MIVECFVMEGYCVVVIVCSGEGFEGMFIVCVDVMDVVVFDVVFIEVE